MANVSMPRRPRIPPPGYDELVPLIERRVAAGITQEEVASVARKSVGWLQTLERGGVATVSSAHRRMYREALEKLEAANDDG